LAQIFDQNTVAAMAEISRFAVVDETITDKTMGLGLSLSPAGLGKIAMDGAGGAPTVHTA
jgi:hypothetical protein